MPAWLDYALTIYAAVVATVVVVRGPEWARAYVLTIVGVLALVVACVFTVAALA
jgi:hypothetical protein